MVAKLFDPAVARPAAGEVNSHIVPMPAWSAPLGAAKFALSLIILILVASATAIWGGYDAFALNLFTASATLIIGAYYYTALTHRPIWYNRWAILSLEICAVSFWLSSFASLAHWTSVFNGDWFYHGSDDALGWSHSGLYPGSRKRWTVDSKATAGNLQKRGTNKYHAGVALAGTAAGLGAVEFILFTVTLAVFAINVHRNCKANGSAAPNNVLNLTAASAEIELSRVPLKEARGEKGNFVTQGARKDASNDTGAVV